MNGGAVAYLTHSKYGRNGTEVTKNNSRSQITGNAGNTISDGAALGTTNAYNTAGGVLASTTGNIYGIYDMSGGTDEYVAAYNSAYSGTVYTEAKYLSASGTHFATDNGGASTKYTTAYTNNSSSYYVTNLVSFHTGRSVSNIGDGLHEVWVTTAVGWFNDLTRFVNTEKPVLIRGGNNGDTAYAGVFCSNYYFRRRFQQLHLSYRDSPT